jgi:hypothetical protein
MPHYRRHHRQQTKSSILDGTKLTEIAEHNEIEIIRALQLKLHNNSDELEEKFH